MSIEMVAERRHHLTDDLLSNLIRAEDPTFQATGSLPTNCV